MSLAALRYVLKTKFAITSEKDAMDFLQWRGCISDLCQSMKEIPPCDIQAALKKLVEYKP